MKINSDKVGRFICELRIKKGLKQSELAAMINVTNKTISKWETGKGFPDISLLEPLSKVLDVSILELLNGKYIDSDKRENEQIESSIDLLVEISNQSVRKRIIKIFLYLFTIILGTLVLGILANYPKSRSDYFFVLLNKLKIIPFNLLYSVILYGNYYSFLKIIWKNIFTASIIYLFYLKIGKKKYGYEFFIIVNLFYELFIWICLVLYFNIDEILIRLIVDFIFYFLHNLAKKGGEKVKRVGIFVLLLLASGIFFSGITVNAKEDEVQGDVDFEVVSKGNAPDKFFENPSDVLNGGVYSLSVPTKLWNLNNGTYNGNLVEVRYSWLYTNYYFQPNSDGCLYLAFNIKPIEMEGTLMRVGVYNVTLNKFTGQYYRTTGVPVAGCLKINNLKTYQYYALTFMAISDGALANGVQGTIQVFH